MSDKPMLFTSVEREFIMRTLTAIADKICDGLLEDTAKVISARDDVRELREYVENLQPFGLCEKDKPAYYIDTIPL